MSDLFFNPDYVRHADNCAAAAEAKNKYAEADGFSRRLRRGKLAVALKRKRLSAEKM